MSLSRRRFLTSLAAVAGLMLVPKRVKATQSPLRTYDYSNHINWFAIDQCGGCVFRRSSTYMQPYVYQGVFSAYDMNQAFVAFHRTFNCPTWQGIKPTEMTVGRFEYEQMNQWGFSGDTSFHAALREHRFQWPSCDHIPSIPITVVDTTEPHLQLIWMST
jgi:hypothetical protein